MSDGAVLCADLGSTWTKCALFVPEGDIFRLRAWGASPTDSGNLERSFEEALICLKDDRGRTEKIDPGSLPLRISSSAKGGLSIAAIGVVPELTLSAARLAACSAGGKLVAFHSYRLTRESIAKIESLSPDIVLLSGGTDGGNERYVLMNAEALAGSSYRGTVLYAGNAAAAEAVAESLRAGGNEVVVTANIMPEIGKLDIEPARDRIREIFLKRIIEGKGLAGLAKRCEGEIRPTPRAVLDLVGAIGSSMEGWSDFLVFDMGGATTDVYSRAGDPPESERTILRGLREPILKRTVEGDLGLRVSAKSVYELLGGTEPDSRRMEEFVLKLGSTIAYLPENEEEARFDAILARTCLSEALLRHAGTIEETYTIDGKAWIRRGKDLRRVGKIVGSGGYLSVSSDSALMPEALDRAKAESGGKSLLPGSVEYWRDEKYIFPLLGGLAASHPRRAAETALRYLGRI